MHPNLTLATSCPKGAARVMPISKVLSTSTRRKVILSHYAAGEECRAHRHVQAQRSLLLAGGYAEDSEAGRREVEGRTLSIKPAWFEHEDQFGDAGALILSVQHKSGDSPLRDYSLSPWRLSTSSQVMRGEDVVGDMESVDDLAGPARHVLSSTPPPPWLREARQRLLDQPELPVATLAQALGRHPVYLARQFRSAFGRPPSQVRQDDRTARAVEYVVRSSRPLADIAFDVGFSDQAHMTRVLKLATGWTPGELRRVLAH